MNSFKTEVLVVGGGAAGLSAALAASNKCAVTIVDDNPHLGGQIWRAELGKVKSPNATRLIKSSDGGGVKIINNAQVFAAPGNSTLAAEIPDGRLELEFEKLIVATGARERFLPFPGWTRPNVFGAGGLQALVKGGLEVENKRVIVAGTGPLLLAVADYLKGKGANIIAVAEQAPASRVNRFAIGLVSSPAKLMQAISLKKRLLGIPYLTDCWITSATGEKQVEQVTLTRTGKTWTVDCDLAACGFDLVPNTELAEILGCTIKSGFVAVDDLQRTTQPSVYCAGEPTGIGGIEASLVEGKIAGLAATGQTAEAEQHFAKREQTRKFAHSLARTFALRDELKTLARPETTVCRCEDVAYGRLTEFESSRDAKLQTRCGMGPCQGRVCGAATEFLFGWKPGTVRPPIFPVRMENL